jgi:hypothetical protein
MQAAFCQLAERNSMLLFSRQTLPGTGFSVLGKEAFQGLEVQDITKFDSG